MKCPICGSHSFYVKHPQDDFETYEFDLKDGSIVFKSEVEESEVPPIGDQTHTHCNKCAWHGEFKALR